MTPLEKLQELYPEHLDIKVLENKKTGNYTLIFENVTEYGVKKIADLVVLKSKI